MAKSAKLTPIQAKLLAIANEGSAKPIRLADLNDPPWDSRRPSSWTTFVPETIYELWEELPLDARLVAYLHAASIRDGGNRYDL